MDTLKTKLEQVKVLRDMKFTPKQAWIVRHCIEFELLHKYDIKHYGYSKGIINRLVKEGVLERHEKNQWDDVLYDLSNEWHKRIKAALNNG